MVMKMNNNIKETKKQTETVKESKLQEFTYVPFKEEKGADYALKMVNIHKSFNNGMVKANVGINLYVKRNSIHAIIGENGAGKSTLMSILFGMYEQDIGEIYINNEMVKFKSSKDANKYRIGMVHQHFKLVDNFTVFDNIVLGVESEKNGFIERRETKIVLRELIQKYNFDIDLDKKVSQLTIGQQQKVEILKVLYRRSEIMIFDEPTAVLSDNEIKSFLEILFQFKNEGKTIIIITHKLHEIKMIADQATVIRKGKYIDTVNVDETSIEKMAELMVGKKVVASKNDLGNTMGEVVLSVQNLDLNYETPIEKTLSKMEKSVNNLMNVTSLLSNNGYSGSSYTNTSSSNPTVSFNVRAGEIYAIAGVEGNGQSNLIKQIAGLKKANPGSIRFMNTDISRANVKTRIELGISHVPEDRHKYGLDLDQDCRLNVVNNQISKKPFSNLGIISDYQIVEYAQHTIDKYDVRGSANGVALARSLSGGNQQKIIVGREMEKDHKLIILAQPTRGLDVGAIQFIHQEIIDEKKKGNAVLLISYELDEILALADTIGVISRNKIIEENSRDIMTREYIGELLAGEKL